MRGRVDEVGEAQEGGGEADGGAVEGGDEDLGVRVEGLGGVKVVGREAREPLLVGVLVGVGFSGDAYVRASVGTSLASSSGIARWWYREIGLLTR